MARFLRTDTNSSGGHSSLRRPTVIDLRPQVYDLKVVLADQQDRAAHNARQRQAKSFLRPPVVVSPPPSPAPPISVNLVAPLDVGGINARRKPLSGLGRPIVLFNSANSAWGFIGESLAAVALPYRPGASSRLSPPAVVNPPAALFVASPISVTLAPQSRGKTLSGLGRPIAVFNNANAAWGMIGQILAPQRRGSPKSKLSPPRVVTAAVAAVTYSGPSVTTAYSLRGRPGSILRKPVVVAPVLARPTDVTFAYPLRGRPKPRLAPPAVVAPVLARAIDVTLARIKPVRTYSILRRPTDLVDQQDLGYVRTHLAYSRRGRPLSTLRKPTVVAPVLARHILVTLAYSLRGRPKTRLSPPAVVAPVLARAIDTTLVRIRPPRTIWVLRKPTDLVDQQDLGYVRTHLAYSLRGAPKSHLSSPTVVGVFVEAVYYGPAVTLAYSLRGQPKPQLAPPTVVAPVLARPIEVTLARIRPVRTNPRLEPPVVVFLAVEIYGPETQLAYSLRGRPKSFLNPPTDLVDRDDLGFVRVHLAPSFRGTPKSRIEPPTVVFPFFARPTDVTLARIRPPHTIARLNPPTDTRGLEDQGYVAITLAYSLRGRPKSILRKPVVIDLRPQTYYLTTWLTYSLRGRPKSILRPEPKGTPQPAPLYPLFVTLAYSRRGKAKPFLRQTIYGAKVYAPITVTLAPSRFPLPKSILRKPTVVAPVLARPIETTLVRIRPQRTLFRVEPPTVVRIFVSAPVVITLAPSRFPRPKSILRKPTVVGAILARPTRVELAPQRRGVPKSRLPIVVYGAKVYAPISVTLAPSSRLARKAISLLAIPTVVRTFVAPQVVVTLAPSRYPKRFYRLAPPAVVGAGIYFRGIEVTLAYSLRGTPKSSLTLTEVITTECYGTVVGFDFAAEVCGEVVAATAVGTDAATGEVCGETSAATVEGASEARGTVSGGDSQREGC